MDRLTEREREVVEQLHVGVPWKLLSSLMDTLIHRGMRLEVGVAGEALDGMEGTQIREVVALLRERNIPVTVHAPFWDLCPGSVDPLVRKVTLLRLHRTLDLCEDLRPIHVVCHTGFDPRHHREHEREFIERSLPLWEAVVKRAERLGCTVVLENVWEETPMMHRTIFSRLPSPSLGFCLDVGHHHCFARAPLGEWIDVLHGYLREIHLHDNDGREDRHLPPGAGTVDFSLLFSRLEGVSCYPLLTIEPHREEHFFETVRNLRRIVPDDFWEKYRKVLAERVSKN